MLCHWCMCDFGDNYDYDWLSQWNHGTTTMCPPPAWRQKVERLMVGLHAATKWKSLWEKNELTTGRMIFRRPSVIQSNSACNWSEQPLAADHISRSDGCISPHTNGTMATQPTRELNREEQIRLVQGVPIQLMIVKEVGCALTSSFLVSPAIGIIDSAIMSSASGRQSLWSTVTSGFFSMLTTPAKFFSEPRFLLIWMVYGSTYVTANLIELYCNRRNISWYMPKFVGSSIANISSTVVKDRAFMRIYGVGNARKLPAISYAMFIIRDSMTVLSSFTIPPLVSQSLQMKLGWSRTRSDVISQMSIPCAIQCLSTPLHLYGLDRYNNPSRTFSANLKFILSVYPKTLCARVARIFPAFGIGGVVNKTSRDLGDSYLIKRSNLDCDSVAAVSHPSDEGATSAQYPAPWRSTDDSVISLWSSPFG